MYKLKDIISSGGTNPKINKAIDRYELSKDEKKDIINTIKNTQQGDEVSSLEYIRQEDLSESSIAINHLMRQGAQFIKVKFNNQIAISPAGLLFGVPADRLELIALGIDFNAKVIATNVFMTFKENLISQGVTQEELDAIPRITKEEFYNLQ